MKRTAYPPVVVLATGLLLSQAVFLLLVYRSNLVLHAKLTAMKAAGYLIVPNTNIMPDLTRIAPAFYGALFFTFTLGAGLCLLAIAAGWLFKGVCKGSQWFLGLLLAGWLASIALVNTGGFSLAATTSLIIIPPVVFGVYVFQRSPETGLKNRSAPALKILAIIIVAVVWLPKTDADIFIDIRDHLLLSNSAGRAINDFYYAYTLYPAALLKGPGQKLMAAACTGGIADPNLRRRVDNTLAAHDYLPVVDNRRCDLYMTQDGERLFLFASRGKNYGLETTPPAFFEAPGKTLARFSEKTDSLEYFRWITFISLFTALPLTLFFLVHGVFTGLLVVVPWHFLRHATASLLCLVIGVGLAAPLYLAPDEVLSSSSDIRSGLNADDWRLQRKALLVMHDSGMDPLRFTASDPLSASSHIPIRYWYASALKHSGQPGASEILLQMTRDPHPNVVCAAYSSLGQIGSTQMVDTIKNRIAMSDHWYIQWYAYKALRRIGWTQDASNTQSSLLQ